jgi:hypothetical protein
MCKHPRMAKNTRRKRGFRNSVVVTFAAAAAAGCAQSNPGQDGSGIDNQPPTFATNPPPTAYPTLAAGSGAAGVAGVAGGIAGGQANAAGAKPPVPAIAPSQMCPTTPPSTGEACSAYPEQRCSYGPNLPCAPMRTLFVRCDLGKWQVTDATPTCNPPPPPGPDEDAGA